MTEAQSRTYTSAGPLVLITFQSGLFTTVIVLVPKFHAAEARRALESMEAAASGRDLPA